MVKGPLVLIFNFFVKHKENPSNIIGQKRTKKHNEFVVENNTCLRKKDLELFCLVFGIMHQQFASKSEIAFLWKHCEGDMRDDNITGLNLNDFTRVLARLSILLYPRLPSNFRNNILADAGLIHYNWMNKENYVMNKNVSDINKWNAFIHFFGLNDISIVKVKYCI